MEDFAEIAWRLEVLRHIGLVEKGQAFEFEELTRLAMTNSPINFDTIVGDFVAIATSYQNYKPLFSPFYFLFQFYVRFV